MLAASILKIQRQVSPLSHRKSYKIRVKKFRITPYWLNNILHLNKMKLSEQCSLRMRLPVRNVQLSANMAKHRLD